MAKAKPPVTITDANGVVWRKTEGGHWRDDKSGKLFSGNGDPVAGAAAGSPSGQPTQQFTQDQLLELQRAGQNLQNQVGNGGITQAQADAEFERLKAAPLNEVRQGNQAASSITGSPNAPDVPQVTPFGQAAGYTPLGTEKNDKTPTGITNTQDLLNQQYMSRQQALNRPQEDTAFGQKQFIQNPDGTITENKTIGNLANEDVRGWTGEQFANQSYLDRGLQAIAGEGGANNQGMAGLLPQLRGMLSKGLDYSGFSPIPTADQFSGDRQRVEDSLYNRFATVNEPLFKQQEADMRQSWQNRGLDPNGERAKIEYEQLQRAQNDARNAARTSTIQMGGQEDQRLYQNSLTSRGQQIGEAQQLRAQPLTDMRGLLSMVNPVQMPQYNQTANIDVPNANFADAAQNQLTRQSAEKQAALSWQNQMAMAQLQASEAAKRQQSEFQNQQSLLQQQQDNANKNKPGFSDYLGGFLGNVGGAALGQGLGQGIGGFFSNLFG